MKRLTLAAFVLASSALLSAGPITINAAGADVSVPAGTASATVADFYMATGSHDVQVNYVAVSFGGIFGALSNFRLFDTGLQIGSTIACPTNGVTMNCGWALNWIVPAGQTRELIVRADVAPNASGVLTSNIPANGITGSELASGISFSLPTNTVILHNTTVVGSPVPEPGTCLLAGLGLAALIFARCRTK